MFVKVRVASVHEFSTSSEVGLVGCEGGFVATWSRGLGRLPMKGSRNFCKGFGPDRPESSRGLLLGDVMKRRLSVAMLVNSSV